MIKAERLNCRACSKLSSTENKIYVRESTFGTQEIFPYYICDYCHSLNLFSPPDKMDRYYGNNKFGSFTNELSLNYFQKMVDKFSISKDRHGIISRFLYRMDLINYSIKPFAQFEIPYDSRILDVGAGNGYTIYRLFSLGFKNVLGIDPFLQQESHSFRVNPVSIEQLGRDETFDVIFMSHVIEHIEHPKEELIKLTQHLNKNGKIILRLPLLGRTFDIYKEYYQMIDAPRHFFIPTFDGLRYLLNNSGLEIENYYYDGTPLSIILSSLYSKGLTVQDFLRRPESRLWYRLLPHYQIIKKQVSTYNKENRGDQITALVRRKEISKS